MICQAEKRYKSLPTPHAKAFSGYSLLRLEVNPEVNFLTCYCLETRGFKIRHLEKPLVHCYKVHRFGKISFVADENSAQPERLVECKLSLFRMPYFELPHLLTELLNFPLVKNFNVF